MVKIMVGYLLASLYGIGAFLVLGYEGLMATPQVSFVFWGLILSGFVLEIINLTICRPVCRSLSRGHFAAKWMRCCFR
ncbi:MAG: hypothetical protein HQL72_04975 [Magnetococcales bacterium]|nr:hypothetical protein [Magnetococcales bacterium]